MAQTRIFMRHLLFFILFIASIVPLSAQEKDDSTFSGVEEIEMEHPFDNAKWSATIKFKHENYQYQSTKSWYVRAMAGYELSDWMKVKAGYDYIVEPDRTANRVNLEATGSLEEGNLSVSLRERYQYKWYANSTKSKNVLRTRLKAQYDIPDSRFSPYLAMEVYYWDGWDKTKHIAGTTFSLNKHLELDAYYMYYLYSDKPAQHILGVGLNVEF